MRLPLRWSSLVPLGRRCEIDGAGFLRSLGFRVVGSGYRTRLGELDLIAWDGDILVFIEVKSLRSQAPPEDAVGFRKRQRVIRAAQSYMNTYHLRAVSYRFDILAISVPPGGEPEFRHIRDAFRV
jgi:putative endonuclease